MRKIKRVTQTTDYCKTGKCVYIVAYDNLDREVYEDLEQMPKEVKDFLISSCVAKKAKAVIVYM